MCSVTTLSKKQIEYLRACAVSPQPSWNAGSTTINRLRKFGLIERISVKVNSRGERDVRNAITDAGRAALAEIPAPIDLMAKLRESVRS